MSLLGITTNVLTRPLVAVSTEKELESQLASAKQVLLWGGESCGKRSVVQVYLQKHQADYSDIVYLQGSSVSELLLSCQKIAKAISVKVSGNLSSQIRNLALFFENRRAVLLILNGSLLKEVSELTRRAHKVILLSQEKLKLTPAIQVAHFTWDEGRAVLESVLRRPLADGEMKVLQNHLSMALHSPVCLTLLGSYYRFSAASKPGLSWEDYLNHLNVDFLTIHKLEAQLMGKIQAALTPHSAKILNVCAYIAGRDIPVSLLQLLFESKLQIFEALHQLVRMGLLEAPFCDPALQFAHFEQLPAMELLIAIPAILQRVVREQQADSTALSLTLSSLDKRMQLDHRHYSSSSVKEEQLLPHVLTALKWTQEDQKLDFDGLYHSANLCNTWGRYFQNRDQFTLALQFYEKGCQILEKGEQLVWDKGLRSKKGEQAEWSLRTKLAHSYGSVCLRLWHQIDGATQNRAKESLEYALNNYRQPGIIFKKNLENRELEEKDYEDLHFRYFTWRAYARLLKAKGELKKAQEIFDDLYTRREYKIWPKGSLVSETRPLALMDRGVIRYLIENERLKMLKAISAKSFSTDMPLNSMSIGEIKTATSSIRKSKSLESLFPSENFAYAFSFLEHSITLYKAPDYPHPNRQKDLAVALTRLGECYLTIIPFCPHERASEVVLKAEEAFVEALEMIHSFNKSRNIQTASQLVARCHFRLAELKEKQGQLKQSLQNVEQAIAMQEELYTDQNRYLVASRNLKLTLEKRLQNFKEKLSKPAPEIARRVVFQKPDIQPLPPEKVDRTVDPTLAKQTARELKEKYETHKADFDLTIFRAQSRAVQKNFFSLFENERDILTLADRVADADRLNLIELHLKQLYENLLPYKQQMLEMPSHLELVYQYLFRFLEKTGKSSPESLGNGFYRLLSTDLHAHEGKIVARVEAERLKIEDQKDQPQLEKIKTKITKLEKLLAAFTAVLDDSWPSIVDAHLPKIKALYSFFSKRERTSKEHSVLKAYNELVELLMKIRAASSVKSNSKELQLERNILKSRIKNRLQENAVMASLADSVPDTMRAEIGELPLDSNVFAFFTQLKANITALDQEARALKYHKDPLYAEKDAKSDRLSELLKRFEMALFQDPEIKKLVRKLTENLKTEQEFEKSRIVEMFEELKKLQIQVEQDLHKATSMNPKGNHLEEEAQRIVLNLVRTHKARSNI